MSNNSDWDNNHDNGDGGSSSYGGLDEAAGTESRQFTETTYKSWFERIKEALGGIVIGFVLLIGAVVLLFWNEGRAVATANSLAEGADLAVEAKADAIDPALEGKLIHVTAPIIVEVDPRDNDFGVTADGVRLVRTVEMYQWKETASSNSQKKLGGGETTVTTYSYAKEWADQAIKSDSFKQQQGHRNPPAPIHGKTFPAAKVWLGAYALTSEQASDLGTAAPMQLSAGQASNIGAHLGRPARLIDDKVVVGRDPLQAQIGDLRISYEAAKVDEASFVAAQRGKGLAPFATKSGDDLLLSNAGVVSAKEMFKDAQEGNTIMTWVLRAFGFFLLAGAFRMMMSIASVLADVVPFFGDLVGAGLGFVAAILGGVLTFLVTGIAWIYYRPILGIALVGAGLALAVWLLFKARLARPRTAAPGATARSA